MHPDTAYAIDHQLAQDCNFDMSQKADLLKVRIIKYQGKHFRIIRSYDVEKGIIQSAIKHETISVLLNEKPG